jgi:hypothetical protein
LGIWQCLLHALRPMECRAVWAGVSEPDARGLDARNVDPATPWKAPTDYRIEEDAAMG